MKGTFCDIGYILRPKAILSQNEPLARYMDEAPKRTLIRAILRKRREESTMSQRLNYMQQSPEFFKKMVEFSSVQNDCAIETTILDLVHLRASQLNGCGFCLDMHSKEAKIHGERELRLYHLPVWRESTLFNPRERAALEWAENLTRLPEHGVPDEVYNRVREQFSEKEISDLTFSIMIINAWNRVSIAFKVTPGSADAAYGLTKAGLS